MQRIFFALVLLLGCVSGAQRAAANDSILSFEVTQQIYTFSTIFDLSSNDAHLGSVVKSSFRVRTNYDLYDNCGNYNGVGICRLATLGAFYSWGREIDVYDQEGAKIGLIDGQAVTGETAKFSIYNAQGVRVGIAFLDQANGAFTIMDPSNTYHNLAILKRNFVENTADSWDVKIYDKRAIDLRIIKVFAAFAVDSQGDFKEDL